jgi:hypothetical protein
MSPSERWKAIAAEARLRWQRHARTVLWIVAGLMLLLAARRLTHASGTLVRGSLPDVVNLLHPLIHRWFSGFLVYRETNFAVHLPATYAILWPFFGWLDIPTARWVWIAVIVAALFWLVYLTVRESGAANASERAFVALIPLSMYPMEMTVRWGQLGVILLPVIVSALLLLHRRPPAWSRDLLFALLLSFAFAKPHMAAPYMWIALFLPGGFRPVALVGLGYIVLTAVAVSYQTEGLSTMFHEWRERSAELAVSAGSANLHLWLAAIELEKWIFPASMLIFFGLGWWVYRHRHVDLWFLLGVTSIVTRFWTYHRPYDDLLLLLPAVALFRHTKSGASEKSDDVAAGALLALMVCGMLIPIRLLRTEPTWGLFLLNGANAFVWMSALFFLVKQAAREKSAQADAVKVQARWEA